MKYQVDTMLTAALNLKNPVIHYYGIFDPPGRNRFVYFELIGGQCHPCFGWIAEGVYRELKAGTTRGKGPRMYYTGISAGLPGPNQFKPARECVGVNAPWALDDKKPGAKDWNALRKAAHSSYMVLTKTSLVLAPEEFELLTLPVLRPIVTFLTIEGKATAEQKGQFKFAEDMTTVIREVFETEYPVIYYGSPVMLDTDEHERAYFKFVGGNFGEGKFGEETRICTDMEPCYGWTGLGPYIRPGQSEASEAEKFSQRYLAIYQRITPRKAVDGISPTSWIFLDMSKEFVYNFVIPS
ncbi:hypothetical protein BDP27DRAFT_1334657 [Rhodocollybia butyracea]|uniref:Uncharacterized protein n=1 Tax=Rhodocollybia butyracea TaxID=206335 RepID=A0A9P5PKL6_9AGAR|nr:hypothetical protein BDP27DRAFT_1334657 [Rhodocollybia butyracea]